MLDQHEPLGAEVSGKLYRCRRLCAADQWALLQRLAPMLPTFYALDASRASTVETIKARLDAGVSLKSLSDATIKDVFEAVSSVVEYQDGDRWLPVPSGLSLSVVTGLVRMVALYHFAAYFVFKRPDFTPVDRDVASFTPVGMPDGEDWLWRPVLRHLCRAESLYDGTLRIEHLARLNAALDVSDENEARGRKATEAAARRQR